MRAQMPWVAACVLAAGATTAGAQEVREERHRTRGYDFAIAISQLQSERTDFDGGTIVSTDSSTGLGFNFDYHFAERWSAGASTAFQTVDYVAEIAEAGLGLGQPGEIVDGELDATSLIGHVKRHFDVGRSAVPYAIAGLGLVSVDTNIPEGPPVGSCWWHPWWGYVCERVQPTRTTTEAGMTVGLGVRWDFNRRLFLDASVERHWIDFDSADRPDFSQLRIAIGFR
jgi:opacity protein-like surface antigen